MKNPIGEFSGNALRTLLDNQIDQQIKGMMDKLDSFDPIDTFYKWHNILFAIEEFINIPIFGIDDNQQIEKILSMPLDHSFISNMDRIKEVKDIISLNYHISTSDRFLRLMMMTSNINMAFKTQGITDFGYGLNLDTIGNAITYYQSRRRYFVTFLYIIPVACKGTKRVEEIQLINELLPILEFSCVGLTTINHQKILSEIYSDFKVVSDGKRVAGNYDFQPLENFFVEPERISLIDQVLFRANQTLKMDLNDVDKKKIFSINELRNSIILLESAYSLYEIENTDFKIYKGIILDLLKYSKDDYFISIDIIEFDNIISVYSDNTQKKLRNLLLNKSKDYNENLNSFHPLIKVGSKYISNLNLLMRFLYYFKNVILNKDKKFQIHSGFVFEDMVKKDLERMDFKVTDIKRINRKEFDVVTIKNHIIYNFQCKNNTIDLTLIESNIPFFVRCNRYLVNYYEKALIKEKGRENLLIKELGIRDVEHFVISRFPVITNDSKIISYNSLKTWNKNNFA